MEEQKIVYGYDKDTREFHGEEVSRLCPVTKSEYLQPAFTTDKKPLEKKEGFAVVFDGRDWQYAPDFRGQQVYDTATQKHVGTVQTLGDLVEGLTAITPEPGQVWVDGAWADDPEFAVKKEKFEKGLAVARAIEERWSSWHAAFEDILDRGVDAVRADRDDIRARLAEKQS